MEIMEADMPPYSSYPYAILQQVEPGCRTVWVEGLMDFINCAIHAGNERDNKARPQCQFPVEAKSHNEQEIKDGELDQMQAFLYEVVQL